MNQGITPDTAQHGHPGADCKPCEKNKAFVGFAVDTFVGRCIVMRIGGNEADEKQKNIMKKIYITCIAEDGKTRNGGHIRTAAKTDRGILRAAIAQIWIGSPACTCGHQLAKIVGDNREIEA